MHKLNKKITRSNSTIGQAVKSATKCAIAPILGRVHLGLLLRNIKTIGLHKGRPATNTKSYIKVCVDGHKVFQTEPISHSSEPLWVPKDPVHIEVFPSSQIKFSLFVCHKFQPDKHIGDVIGTAWTFASQREAYHHIDSTNLYPAMQIDLDFKTTDVTHEQDELEDMMHDIDVRSIQSVKRTSSYASRGSFAIQGQTLESVERVVDLLIELSPMFQVCKVAVALVKIAHQILEAMKEIDATIECMYKCMHEVAVKALACTGDIPIPGTEGTCRRVIDLAARSAEIVDRWVDSTTARPFIKDQVKAQIYLCQRELQEVQDNLHFNVEVALYRVTASHALDNGYVHPRVPSASSYCSSYYPQSRQGSFEKQVRPDGSSARLAAPTYPPASLKSKQSHSQIRVSGLLPRSPALSSSTLCSDSSRLASPARGRPLHREGYPFPDAGYNDSDVDDESDGQRDVFAAPDELPDHPENILIRPPKNDEDFEPPETDMIDGEFIYDTDDEEEMDD